MPKTLGPRLRGNDEFLCPSDKCLTTTPSFPRMRESSVVHGDDTGSPPARGRRVLVRHYESEQCSVSRSPCDSGSEKSMAKAKTAYACTECGGQSTKWQGQCPHCGVWNTLVETISAPPASRFQALAGAAGSASSVQNLASVEAHDHARQPTGIEEFDRVLGGGLVPG